MAYAPRQKNLVQRAKSAGFNHLIGYDYNFAPGTVGYIDDFYREASKAGMLVSLTMPHIKNFNFKLDDPVEAERYRSYAESKIRRFQNLPGMVFYAMNHNGTGYHGDQNPQKTDGIFAPDKYMKTESPRSAMVREQAQLAAKIVRSIDPSRPIYHHESGNLGEIITINCYLDWVPQQERSDWFETWEQCGTKPLMLVEWGMPHIASWSSYRGPGFIWRIPSVQCIWINEFNASILGEEAYRSSDIKQSLYRCEDEFCRGNQNILFSKLCRISQRDPDLGKVRAWMTADNFRSMRARGISGLLPWDQALMWEKQETVEPPALDPFANLKQPGIVPDIVCSVGNEMIKSFDHYVPSKTGEGALPMLQPEIGWIAGKSGDFTEKSHNFRPGETVSKQLLVLNDTRHNRTVECTWELPALNLSGKATLKLDPGTRAEAPIEFTIPSNASTCEMELRAEFRFEDDSTIKDRFTINVIPKASELPKCVVGLFDPAGHSTPLFKELGLTTRPVRLQADLKGVELLVIGRGGLKNFPLLLSKALRSGLKLLILEQDYTELIRLGFRGNIHGLRNVFPLDGTPAVHDWRGSTTLIPPTLETPPLETKDPTWDWNGFTNTRAWRAGNRGIVNSVLLEKPSIGNFMPLYHGGFDLQYATALEWNQQVIFSQFDLSGRTDPDPEATELLRKLLLRLDQGIIKPACTTYYSGNQCGSNLLTELGIRFSMAPNTLPDSGLLVIGPGAKLSGIADAMERGLSVIAIGLDQTELERHFPGKFQTTTGKFFSEYVHDLAQTPEYTGISNAELHWRTELPMTAFDTSSPGGRALQLLHSGKGKVIAVQIAPWMFDEKEQAFRTTRRRTYFLISRLLYNLGAESVSDGFEVLDGCSPNGGGIPLLTGWVGKTDPNGQGQNAGWFKPDFRADESWRPIKVARTFESQFKDLWNYDGKFWYRLNFNLPEAWKAGKCELNIGAVDDESWIWLNGKFLGEVSQKTHPNEYWGVDRHYEVDAKNLKAHGNVLVVLCNDLRGNGGMVGMPGIRVAPHYRFYADTPQAVDDPYRYYRW